jgi:hypothetical protein
MAEKKTPETISIPYVANGKVTKKKNITLTPDDSISSTWNVYNF